MRRLPIFFLLDVSESMIGTKLIQLEDGMNQIITDLRRDPYALETAYISVIAFAGKSEAISSLTDLESFYPPRLPIGGGTSLGSALKLLMNEMNTRVSKQTKKKKGDWKPIVFLITDGRPTDNPYNIIQEWNDKYSNSATIIAIALGNDADTNILKKFANEVLIYNGSSNQDFKKFISWISNSIKAESKNVDENIFSNKISLEKLNDKLEIVKEEKVLYDENTVVLTGRCQTNKMPYLIKYSRDPIVLKSLEKHLNNYYLDGCYPIVEDYFNWSSDVNINNKINVNLLINTPSCPHCKNISAFAICGFCEKILCINGEGKAICPWCNSQNNFVFGDNNFDVYRNQG